MPVIGAAACDDIDDARGGAAEFRGVIRINDAKFLHRFLRRRAALDARRGGDIIRAIHGNKVVMNVLTGERKLGHRLHDHVGASRRSIADGHRRREQRKVDTLGSAWSRVALKLPLLQLFPPRRQELA